MHPSLPDAVPAAFEKSPWLQAQPCCRERPDATLRRSASSPRWYSGPGEEPVGTLIPMVKAPTLTTIERYVTQSCDVAAGAAASATGTQCSYSLFVDSGQIGIIGIHNENLEHLRGLYVAHIFAYEVMRTRPFRPAFAGFKI
jgi:hypothetical protein